jgi:protein Hikeshi
MHFSPFPQPPNDSHQGMVYPPIETHHHHQQQLLLQQQQQPQPQPPFFGLIIPGRAVRTDFAPIDATGLKFAVTLTCPGDIPQPIATTTEMVLFWTQAASAFPPGQGILCYWQMATAAAPATTTNTGGSVVTTTAAAATASTGFQLLGAITADSPSRVFQTGWSEHEELMEHFSKPGAAHHPAVTVTIALSVEPLANIQNILSADANVGFGAAGDATSVNSSISGSSSRRLFVAQKIALDLFRFMQSFDSGNGGHPGQMLVPNNIFDRWFKRFEARFQSTFYNRPKKEVLYWCIISNASLVHDFMRNLTPILFFLLLALMFARCFRCFW